MGKFVDITGCTYGNWEVLNVTNKRSNGGNVKWLCRCTICGNIKEVDSNSLRTGDSTNCGCVQKEKARKNIYNLRKKYSTYDLTGEYGVGTTTKGDKFIFDIDDYDKIKNWCWSVNENGYVISNNVRDKSPKILRMHRLIMGVTDSNIFIDHINHNKKDNRKSNLRLCTKSQNMMNLRPRKNKIIPKGVTVDNGSYIAYITENRNRHILGRYKNVEDAVMAREAAERKYYGEFNYDPNQDYKNQ